MPRDPFNTVQQDAAWAEQFKNSTSSLAQRQRYAEQRAAGEVDRETEDLVQFEQAQIRDPRLGQLMLGRQRERRMGFEAEASRNLRERQFGFQQNRAARQDELAQKKFGLDVMKAEMAEEKAIREIDDAAQIKIQTKAFQDAYYDLRKNGIMPGMPGFAEGIGAAIVNSPLADPDVLRAAASDARIEMDPADLQFEANRLGYKNPKFTVRQDKEGRKVYGLSEGAAPKDDAPEAKVAAAEKRLFDLQDRLKSGIGEEDRALVSELATEARTALQALRGGATREAPQANQATAMPTVTTKEQRDALPPGSKYIRDGVTYTKQ